MFKAHLDVVSLLEAVVDMIVKVKTISVRSSTVDNQC